MYYQEQQELQYDYEYEYKYEYDYLNWPMDINNNSSNNIPSEPQSSSFSPSSYACYVPDETLSYANRSCKLVFERLELDRKDQRSATLKIRKASSKLLRESISPDSQGEGGGGGGGVSKSCSRRRYSYNENLPRPGADYLNHLSSVISSCGIDIRTGLVDSTGGRYLQLDRALVHLCFVAQQYEDVHRLIRQMVDAIPIELDREIEELWDNSTYILQGKGQTLNSVNRYRLRERCKCPTIERTGGKRYNISPKVKEILWTQFNMNPTPNKADREQLIKQTGLSKETICNWFKNRRQRAKASLRLQI